MVAATGQLCILIHLKWRTGETIEINRQPHIQTSWQLNWHSVLEVLNWVSFSSILVHCNYFAWISNQTSSYFWILCHCTKCCCITWCIIKMYSLSTWRQGEVQWTLGYVWNTVYPALLCSGFWVCQCIDCFCYMHLLFCVLQEVSTGEEQDGGENCTAWMDTSSKPSGSTE